MVLKRLSDALADRDRIHAVIRGSAVNQDGRSSGLTAPNGAAQEAVIRQALANGGWKPEDVGYIEAHGTGTALGDPIEAHALASVFGPGRSEPLVVGSVKTNLGHLESAAGVAGLIKVVLSMQQERIPRHLHFQHMNPHIDWGLLTVRIPTESMDWKRGAKPRVAGVSSFGFSGTNAHVIVEEAPRVEPEPRTEERPLHILTVSGRSAWAVEQLNHSYAEALQQSREDIGDFCYTANAGRAAQEYRCAVVGANAGELAEKLRAGSIERMAHREGVRVAFLFPGQGSQYVGMSRGLYETHPVYRATIQECSEWLKPHWSEALEEVLWGRLQQSLGQTRYTQPALFAIEYGLAQLWRSWGIEPWAVVGHSVGEYVAACVAGACEAKQGLELIAIRAELMQGCGGEAGMSAVWGTEAEAIEAIQGLEQRVSLAAVNGPESVVISGYVKELEEAETRLRKRGKRVQRLAVSHGFHSPQMEEMAGEWSKVVGGMKWSTPRIEWISTLTADRVREQDLQGNYWQRQVREPVRFKAAIERVDRTGVEAFLEAGPGTTLTGLGQQTISGEGKLWLASLRSSRPDWEQMLDSAGKLWTAGAELNWSEFDRPYHRRRVSLPTYPFERQSYWLEAQPAPAVMADGKQLLHPFLGTQVDLAGDATMSIWESPLRIQDHPFLADHATAGAILFPLAGFLDLMTAVAPVGLTDITIHEPLALNPAQTATLQVQRDRSFIRVYSRHEEGWTLHASAQLASDSAGPESDALNKLQERIPNSTDVASFYDWTVDRGMNFGPTFRLITGLWTNANEALARVEQHGDTAAESKKYGIHPTVLDACLQAYAALLPREGDALYLPVALQGFALRRKPGKHLWSHVKLVDGSAESGSLRFDAAILDEHGIVASVRGVEVRRVSGLALRNSPSAAIPSLFEVQWERQDLSKVSETLSGNWLVIADESGLAKQIEAQLVEHGARVEVTPSPEPLSADIAWTGVIYLRALRASSTTLLDENRLRGAQRAICEGALQLVQNLAANPSASETRLWLISRNAKAVSIGEPSIEIAQAPLWGMALAIADEHPQWRCTCIDLDRVSVGQNAALLMAEICSGTEDQVAFRNGERYVARLTDKVIEPDVPSVQRLTIASRGLIDNLKIEAATRQPVPAGWVEIQADATGLNFRDVLSVLGLYPGDPGSLGEECAGYVVSVGSGVRDLKPGDRVIAICSGAHDGFVYADARLVCPAPSNLNDEAAAAIPIAFTTARYCLEHVANVRAGQRVLIHAATGGVGLAAVELAQRAGAQIFATAGSERKRELLRSRGVMHVMNSRTTDFARQALDLTEGRGVDIVLNSLTGDAIPASLSAMRQGGCFVEIGKRGIWTHDQVASLNRDVRYHVVDIGRGVVEETELVGSLLRRTAAEIERSELAALPITVFPFSNAAGAYRFMAQAQHIGKIVLRQSTCASKLLSDATYLVVGGFGALGQMVARWLVGRGARNIVLAGRSTPSREFEGFAQTASEHGVRVVARTVDIASEESLSALMAQIKQEMPPLRGVVHAAGVLDDGVLTEQTWPRFERVLAPKVSGSWLLHKYTESLPLDFFVLFSSMASALRAPGQANYAAANAFEDALAQERRRSGLAATSINWGSWAAGVASRDGLEQRRQQAGIGSLSEQEGFKLLDQILLESPAQVGAGIIDWKKFVKGSGSSIPGRFERFVRQKSASAPPAYDGLLTGLNAAPAAGRLAVLRDHIRKLAAQVLGFPADRPVDLDRPLSELGLDSLMSVEFRNALGADVKRSFPATLLFSHPSVEEVSSYVLGLLFANETVSPAPAASADLLDHLEELSDEEIDAMLSSKTGDGR